MFLALDSPSRIIEMLAYLGAGGVVGFVTGLALRLSLANVKSEAKAARREASLAVSVSEEARGIALRTADEARALKA